MVTQFLVRAAGEPGRLPEEARSLPEDPANQPCFSPVSLWEIAIKSSLGRADFQLDAGLIRRGLTDNGYLELPISGEHAVRIANLQPSHSTPFDRTLVAQAQSTGHPPITGDPPYP